MAAKLEIESIRRTLAEVVAGVVSVARSNAVSYTQPLTENSPGVKLRRAAELYRKSIRP